MEEKLIIVKRPAVLETLSNMNPGTSATFDCREFAPLNSVQSAVSRLNSCAGRREFSVVSDDNGATYTVSRSISQS